MDVIKAELEVDPLSVETSDDTDEDEKKPILEERKLVDQLVTGIKEEYVDQSHDLTSEIKFEEDPVPISFCVVKREPEEEQSDFHEEPRAEVTAEDNEVFAESIAATNERTVTSEFGSLAPEVNGTVCEIPKNSGCSEKPSRTREDEKKFEFELSKMTVSNSEKLSGRPPKDAGKKPLKCDVCNKFFSRAWYLKTHQRQHSSEKPFKCDVCCKSFSQSCSLKMHKLLHTGEKPFKCDVCGKCFSQLVNLRCHKRIHNGEKPFKCDVCYKHFSTRGSLKKHQLIHKGVKPFQCDVCGRFFSQSIHLKCHKRWHTGEKPFQCDVCGKCFSLSIQLGRHKHWQTYEKPFECDVCSKSF
ncbi:zinc finger protein 239-like [Periplaneta americana]|uniref:zinc finger protein 239-like n=1 Tax=Periplaneta americana TaxID=6978 RepID=UPI0037E75008